MKLRLELTETAVEGIAEALGYLADRNLAAALALRVTLQDTLTLLAEGLVDGPRRTLSTGEEVRRFVVRPLLVYYVRTPPTLRVLYVRDARRAPIER